MQLSTVTSENIKLWCWYFLVQIASSENLTFKEHFDFKKRAHAREYPGTARPPHEGPEDKPECSFHFQCLQIGCFNAHSLWQFFGFFSWSWSSKPWRNSKLFEIPNQRTDCVDSKKSKQTITFKNKVLEKTVTTFLLTCQGLMANLLFLPNYSKWHQAMSYWQVNYFWWLNPEGFWRGFSLARVVLLSKWSSCSHLEWKFQESSPLKGMIVNNNTYRPCAFTGSMPLGVRNSPVKCRWGNRGLETCSRSQDQ